MARLAAPGLTRDRGAISGPLELGACRSIEGCHGFAGAPRACGGYGGYGGYGGPFEPPMSLEHRFLHVGAPDVAETIDDLPHRGPGADQGDGRLHEVGGRVRGRLR